MDALVKWSSFGQTDAATNSPSRASRRECWRLLCPVWPQVVARGGLNLCPLVAIMNPVPLRTAHSRKVPRLDHRRLSHGSAHLAGYLAEVNSWRLRQIEPPSACLIEWLHPHVFCLLNFLLHHLRGIFDRFDDFGDVLA